MSGQGASAGASPAQAPKPAIPVAQREGFPRIYAVVKWVVILSLAFLALLAAAAWTVILGGFAASGFRATEPAREPGVPLVMTPECAWPYSVDDREAEAVCRMFHHLTPEQRAQALSKRK